MGLRRAEEKEGDSIKGKGREENGREANRNRWQCCVTGDSPSPRHTGRRKQSQDEQPTVHDIGSLLLADPSQGGSGRLTRP